MRQMFAEFSVSGYSSEDFQETASKVAGEDLSDWFESVVNQTDELDFSDLEALGLQFAGKADLEDDKDSDKPPKNAMETENETPAPGNKRELTERTDSDVSSVSTKDEQVASDEKPWLGIRASGNGGRLVISHVTSNSPATVAGLNPRDEIIAINDFRVGSSLDERLKQFKVGDKSVC